MSIIYDELCGSRLPKWDIEFTSGATITNMTIKEAGMHFKNDVERKAWADYVGLRMPSGLEDHFTSAERRAQMVKVCEEADWLIEEMRRRA